MHSITIMWSDMFETINLKVNINWVYKIQLNYYVIVQN